MAEFNQENNTYYLSEQRSVPYGAGQPVQEAQPVPEKAVSGSAQFFSLPARIGMWFVGVIVGLTLIFGCGIFWVWGLNYIGLIDTERNAAPQPNDFNQSGDDYSEFEDFYNYFDDYFGGPVAGDDEESDAAASTPGIGVTIQEITLEFTIEDKYDAGLVIVEINEKGAFAGTDAQVGDLIVAVNGEKCPNIDTLDVFLQETGIGGEMIVTLARYTNGVASTFEVPVTLIDISTLN